MATCQGLLDRRDESGFRLIDIEQRFIDRIFSEALQMPAADRASFVREKCRKEPESERRIIALLTASDTPDEELSGPFDNARQTLWSSLIGSSGQDREDLSGQRIGIWLLKRKIARGGLSTVYLAGRNDDSFEQKVAFKVLRRGLDTDDVVARFRAERQILSTLEHPSIAGILDGGSLEDGRPYLVLEFVDGVPITRYCEDSGIDIQGRVQLMIQVLDALHHAHKHLIVHRDIKPSNILVRAEGRVSLLDFGISKLLDPEMLPGGGTLTRTGVSLLTPGYGSPEQQAGRPVTTASDIYQVGLVAYEMITATRPFEGPGRPSDTDPVAPSRKLPEGKARRVVTGDLDAIICKALHEEPARRYGSALDMRDDLKRYLDCRPVIARPDTLGYRLFKLIRRRFWLLPTLATGSLAVVAYLVTLTSYTAQLKFEKGRAQEAEAFMVNLLRSPDPFTPADPERGSSITVVEALDIGVEKLRSDPPQDPKLRASLLASISGVYASLDQPRPAIELRTEALALEQELYGFESRPVMESLEVLGIQSRSLRNFDQAEWYHDQQLAVARNLFSDFHPQVGRALASKAEAMSGDRASGERLYEEAIARLRSDSRSYSRPLINALVALSGLKNASSSAEAEALLNEARQLASELFGSDSLSMALIHARAGTNASDNRDFVAAELAFSSALEIYEKKLGPEHGATNSALNNLGVARMSAGDQDSAEQVFRQLLERYGDRDERPQGLVAGLIQNLATVLGRQGRFEEAIPLHQEAFERFQSDRSGNREVAAYPLISIAYAELQLKKFVAAEQTARQALDLLHAAGSGPYPIGVAQCLAGLALERQGFDDDAQPLLALARASLSRVRVDSSYGRLCGLELSSTPHQDMHN